MCCCGNGVGTSLLMQMTIEEALGILGIYDVEVVFGSLSGMTEGAADLFVVSKELLPTIGNRPAIGLENMMDADLAAEILKDYFMNS